MVYHSQQPTMAVRAVLRVLERSSTPLTSKDIAALGDLKISTTRNVLTHLVRAGHVVNATPQKRSFMRYKIAPAKAQPSPAWVAASVPVAAPAPGANPKTEIVIKLSRADYEAFQRIYKAITLEVWADPVLGQYADAGGE